MILTFNTLKVWLINPETEIPQAFGPAAAGIQRAFDSQWLGYNSVTFGVRYDFQPGAALKFEYNSYKNIVDISPASTFGTNQFASLGTPDDKGSVGELTIALQLVF